MWRQDQGMVPQLSPYPDVINISIENKFQELRDANFYQKSFETQPIVRFIDDKPQEYIIDFERMKQINKSTRYERDIIRQATGNARWTRSSNDNIIFEFLSEGNIWRPYDSLCQAVLRDQFQSYCDGGAAKIKDLRFPDRPEQYTISFSQPMHQLNQVTNAYRGIRFITVNGRKEVEDDSNEKICITITNNLNVNFDINDVISQLSIQLHSIVKSAIGVMYDEWDLPILTTGSNDALALTLVGQTKILAGLLIGRIKTLLSLLFQLTCQVSTFKTSKEFELRINSNPRLSQISTNTLPIIDWNLRDDAVLFIAHVMIWSMGFSVAGGFVRDWVIRGDSANDVDTIIPSHIDATIADKQIKSILKSVNNHLEFETYIKGQHQIHSIKVSSPYNKWHKHIEIDLVSANKFFPSPGADADVDNLKIDSSGNLVKKAESAGGKHISLLDMIRRCEEKTFVFFYRISTVGEQICQTRLIKLIRRGWTCVGYCGCSDVEKNDFFKLIPQDLLHQVVLNPQFCKQWDVIS